MHIIDVILLIPILIGAWLGFRNGFILSLTTLIAFALATYAGIWFSDLVSGFIISISKSNSEYIPLISFSVCFIAICALVFFIGKWMSRLAKIVLLGSIDKLAGGFFGLAQFTLITAVVFSILDAYVYRSSGKEPEWRSKSVLYSPLTHLNALVWPGMEEQISLIYSIQEIQSETEKTEE
ncbi:MAG: CvpA family protein [Flavobacteriales bacterium]|nr:CvpA family protein [Flavobacteriales bacterium]